MTPNIIWQLLGATSEMTRNNNELKGKECFIHPNRRAIFKVGDSNDGDPPMDDAPAPKKGRLDFLSAKVSNGMNKATETATRAAGVTVRVAEKTVEALKNENVQTAITLGVTVVAAVTKARTSGGGLAKRGFELLSDVTSGLSQVKPQNGSGHGSDRAADR